jgi:hypothetical protein
MRQAFMTFLLGAAVGAGGMYLSRTYHVVRGNDGFHLVPKMTQDFSDPYVDVRNFDPRAWDDHRALAVALVKANKGHLITAGVGDNLRNAARGVLEMLEGNKTH